VLDWDVPKIVVVNIVFGLKVCRTVDIEKSFNTDAGALSTSGLFE